MPGVFFLSKNIPYVPIRDLFRFLLREIHAVEDIEIGVVDLLRREVPVVGVVRREQQPVCTEGAQDLVRLSEPEGAHTSDRRPRPLP